MDKKELLKKALIRTKVPACDTAVLGFLLGHLTDHGMSNDELRALVDTLINAIAALRSNPQALKDLQNALASIGDQVRKL